MGDAGLNGCPESPAPCTCTPSTQFCFMFSICHTPVVTDMSVVGETVANNVLTFTGKGFGTSKCQNKINLCGYEGETTSSSGSSITGKLACSSNSPVPLSCRPTLRMHNLGNAYLDIENPPNNVFYPGITSITPSKGSTVGGTIITVNGCGFISDDIVEVDGIICHTIEITYTYIKCKTQPHAQATDVPVTVSNTLGDRKTQSKCETNCIFSYMDSSTPKITSITPTALQNCDYTLTITGSNLGDLAANVEIKLADSPCENVVFVTAQTKLTCTVNTAIKGTHILSAHIKGQGDALMVVDSIVVSCGFSSISQLSGSTQGGLKLTITGCGFGSDTSITVDDQPWCVKTTITPTSITCVTPAKAADTVSTLIIKCGGQVCGSAIFTHKTGDTPTVTNTDISTGSSDDTLTISGTLFDTGAVLVTLGTSECIKTASDSSTITCTVGIHPAGTVDVNVHIDGLGYAEGTFTFAYELTVTSLDPASPTGKTVCSLY